MYALKCVTLKEFCQKRFLFFNKLKIKIKVSLIFKREREIISNKIPEVIEMCISSKFLIIRPLSAIPHG